MTRLLILGAGGHARVLAETALAQGNFSQITFLDDFFASRDRCIDLPVIGTLDLVNRFETLKSFPYAIVGIGDIVTRLHWLRFITGIGYQVPVIVHPTAWVSPSASLGGGSVVFAHSCLQANAHAGLGVILNTGSSVDHDSLVADGSHICPGAHIAGDVRIGSRCLIGTGASIKPQVTIGNDVTVGAGASVVHDLPDGVTAVGVPALVR